ncbi:MAG: glycogen debranching N-terminal domain-containing protein [Candidatus Methylomirabilales bacterium]
MEDIIKLQDKYYILATSARADERTRVLKHGETFAVFDHSGDVVPFGLGEQGLYHEGTRFLSRLQLRLGGARPLLLSSTVRNDNALLTVDLTNPDIQISQDTLLPRGRVHLFRSTFLHEATCYECLRISNYSQEDIDLILSLAFEADFADIFEVRGMRRVRTGEYLGVEPSPGGAEIAYRGLDGVTRRLRVRCEPPPYELSESTARFRVQLKAQETTSFSLAFACLRDGAQPATVAPQAALAARVAGYEAARARQAGVSTSHEQFNEWLARSRADLHMLVTETPEGPYPYAGVPWFSAPFGRDGLITALQVLWLDPALARGVLGYLAATQAGAVVAEQDAEPGKILHETRRGEMAALKEIPFGRYYGSVDATPLFVVLAGAYYERTADLEFLQHLWPSITRALDWIDRYGDLDGDGFVEYSSRTARGLLHQGWKDSQDSVFHADGRPAEGPIALCEVQGYAYAARQQGVRLATVLGKAEAARRLAAQAEDLRVQFEREFWVPEMQGYALALDGEKEPCRVRTSNAGHALLTRIASPERAALLATGLLGPEFFSGWGIRTVAANEVRYNPMSYHNGSVWPHDNALIALGLARYDHGPQALSILGGLFDASLFLELHRMPELFCGFKRRPGEGPTAYPVACAPQAWAAGAVFMLLQACLGLSIDAAGREILFHRPLLPPFLERVRLTDLRVADASVDLLLERHTGDVAINVLRREGQVQIVETH